MSANPFTLPVGNAPLALPSPSLRIPHAVPTEVCGIAGVDLDTQAVALSVRTADGKAVLLLSRQNADFLVRGLGELLCSL